MTVPQHPESEVRMSFFGHIEELRRRLLFALYGIVPPIIGAWFYRDQLLDWLARPLVIAYRNMHLGHPQLHQLGVVDAFVEKMKIAILTGVLIASPWVFWQVWSFIAPGLYSREKKLALPFVLASTAFFVGGALFAYFVVFPAGFETLLGFAGILPSGDLTVQPTITIGEYVDFCLSMLLAFGVVFEVPVIITFLALAGIVNWKQLMRFSRWWMLIASILAAVLTPTPDIGSQLIMFIPLVVLYFVSVGIAYFFGPKPKVEDDLPDDATG